MNEYERHVIYQLTRQANATRGIQLAFWVFFAVGVVFQLRGWFLGVIF
jgi:hypothetical protein